MASRLSAGWFTPLDGSCPTLAEFLGSRGYATAGFVANEWYCGSDSGLARGFTEYHDYAFPRLTAFKTASLVNRPVNGVQATEQFLEDWLDIDVFKAVVNHLLVAFHGESQGCGGGQSRVPRVAHPTPAAGAAILRLSQFL